jgi:3,4-dihydroxy 2-butanone 4-phosphate synthase/GTP cyclohydrolase II
LIEREGKGVLVYINRTDSKLGLLQEMQDLLTDNPRYTSSMDNRDYGIGAQILRAIGVRHMRIITNHPELRRAGLDAYGLEITDTLPLQG